MTSKEAEIFNELAQVALDAEMRFRLLSASLKGGNKILSQTHLEKAHNVCHRLENELAIMEK